MAEKSPSKKKPNPNLPPFKKNIEYGDYKPS